LHFHGAGLEGANTAEPTSFTIEAKSRDGGRARLVQNPFGVEVVGANGAAVRTDLRDNNDGTFTVTYQAVHAGDHTVNVQLKHQLRVGVVVGTDASKSRAFGPGLQDGVQDNLPTHFTIEARGTDGQPMGKGGDPFVVKIQGPAGDVPNTITDNGDGTYTVNYAPEHAGPHTVNVTLKDKPVDRSPYTVNVREGADHRTSLIESFKFVIQSKTKADKPMTRGGENFTVDITNPAGSRVDNKLEDLRNGQYACTFSLANGGAGNYKLDVKVNGKDILGSPFNINF